MKDDFFVKSEKEILNFWKEKNIFEKSVKGRPKTKNFVFYEGPPTANARPGIHHVLARAFKDIVCRYKTMRGFRVIRKAGWDTHGLPVELEIEKKHGFHSKKDIEKYGLGKFCKECKTSVFEYKKEWENLTDRIGYWLDMKNPYITYDTNYIETLWWILKEIKKKSLLYQGYKVVPYCPRCATPLSSHEVAQGYKNVKDPAIYVKFPAEDEKNTYFLVWTTTPWTLPGNVALAVNSEFTYVKVKTGKEYLILLKDRLEELKEDNWKVISSLKGQEILGKKYKPLFPYLSNAQPENIKNAFQVLPGEFVSSTEGTGIVHIAPMYGEDDFQLGKKFNLPFYHTVDETGCFVPEVKQWARKFVKDADPEIIDHLKEKGLLFKKELYAHDYPFCWRCKTPLLYYARKSWFIKMTSLKQKLLRNNEKINWMPPHIKYGRFGEWLKDIKDWTLSRDRFWGTPLPVWKCSECGHTLMIGSIKELTKQKSKSGNKYILMRHGESIVNVKEVIVTKTPEKIKSFLTEKGKSQALKAAQTLKKEGGVDVIFTSDIQRAKETAEIVGKVLGIKPIIAKELRELNAGEFEGKSLNDFFNFLNSQPYEKRFTTGPKKGESYNDVKMRIYKFVKKLEKQYKNKTILLVSHEITLDLLKAAVLGLTPKEYQRKIETNKIKTGEIQKIEFRSLPYNKNGEIDLHRPFIDEVEFRCPKCKVGVMKRVPEVLDCWFDSGSMPFAQYHYPFENKKLIDKKIQFPADYIAEGIDQTRGWFYTLLAISTLLKNSISYKTAIALGLVLDEKGRKMSKSLGNTINPWDMVEKHGADAVRWYFYTMNQPGQEKRFSERELLDYKRKFLMTLWNSFTFFNTYSPKIKPVRIEHPLNKWILSRLNNTIKEITLLLEKYDITASGRQLQDFVVNDLSQWYIRRARRVFQKPSSKKELSEFSWTLASILLETSKLAAPFVPFISEKIYQGLKKKLSGLNLKQSVHLDDWPKSNQRLIDKSLEEKMNRILSIVSEILRERKEVGIKVRQPLAEALVPKSLIKSLSKELLDLAKEETNIKKISPHSGTKIKLDTHITAQLREEGIVREIIRTIQQMRKEAGLTPSQKISIQAVGDKFLNEILEKNKQIISSETIAKSLTIQKPKKKASSVKTLLIDNHTLEIAVFV